MHLIDSHCHQDNPLLDREQMLVRTMEMGLCGAGNQSSMVAKGKTAV
ncbi:MAG: hypothetical protein V3U62_02000 [Sedimenticolaceae bacterium]